MRSISFEEGLKSFSINNDERRVMRFNPGDPNLLTRAKDAQIRISEKQEKMKEIRLNADGTPVDKTEEVINVLRKFENLVREEINYVFNADVYDVVFGGQSPLCIVGKEKEFLFEAFMQSTMPIIEEEVDAFNADSKKRVDKYTKGYLK